jgi:RTX calcium-binding nonapeptide repeat (4 copies)
MALIYNLLVEVLHGTDDSDLMISAGHNKIMLGHQGNDYMAGFQGADVEAGGFGNDTVIGWTGADMLFGNEGSDLVIGQYDPDLLIGGKDNDTLYGGKDNDTLYGNQGVNELLGGTGADIFAMVPSVRHEHEEIPVNVLVGFHEETVVTITTEVIDPPPHEEEVTVREDAPGRPDEGASQAAWDNYARRSIAAGYTLVEYAPDDLQQLFPTYYREDIEIITVDPPPHTIEVERITTLQVPDYEVQLITVDRTLLAFDGLAVIADFTPGLDHLSITGPEVPAGVAHSITARDVSGALTLSYEGADIAVLLGHTTREYSTSWFGE